MNGLGKPFTKKNPIQKIEKTVNIKRKFPRVNKKTTSENANFCSNAVFSLYIKIRAKKIHAAKALAFSLHFLFRRDQNHPSNLTSKIMKMCEQIFKKRQRLNTIHILWIVKTKRRPIIAPAIAVRLLIKKRLIIWQKKNFISSNWKVSRVKQTKKDYERFQNQLTKSAKYSGKKRKYG